MRGGAKAFEAWKGGRECVSWDSQEGLFIVGSVREEFISVAF